MPLNARSNNDDDFEDDFTSDDMPDADELPDYEDLDFSEWDGIEEDEY